MSNEKDLLSNKDEGTVEVEANDIPSYTRSVTVTKTSGMGQNTSSYLEVSSGVLQITARNTSSQALTVELVYQAYATLVHRRWTVAANGSLNTGQITVPGNVYAVRIGRNRIPERGSATLTAYYY